MKKKAEIRSVDCDGDFLEDWKPGREWDFAIQIVIEIGLEGNEGGCLFYLEILPRQFFEACPLPRFVNRSLVLDHYDPRLIKDFINRIVSGYEFENWEKCVEHLSYYFSHEYENYNT